MNIRPASAHAARARALLLDPASRETLGRGARLTSLALHAPLVMLGVVEDQRIRVLARVGLPAGWPTGGLLPATHVLCRHALASPQAVVVDDCDRDPLTREDAGLEPRQRAYCGLALRVPGGEPVAVLVAMDVRPRRWTHGQVSLLREIGADLMRDIELAAQRPATEQAWRTRPLTPADEAGGAAEVSREPESGPEATSPAESPAPAPEPQPAPAPASPDLTLRELWDQVVRFGPAEAISPPAAEPAAPESAAPPAPTGESLRDPRAPEGPAPRPEPSEPGGGDREARWRALFEEAGSAIFMTTAEGRLTDFNGATLRLLGCTEAEAARLLLFELLADPVEQERLRSELAANGAVPETEVRVQRCDGASLSCLITVGSRHDASGRLIGLHGTLRDITEQKNAEQRLLESAFQDPLTDLPNRALLLDRLERLLRYSKRRAGHRFAVLFIDLNDFKAVNDTYGHQAGDRLLMNVARRLEHCVRQEDTVARIGGDEFAILLDGIGDVSGVVQVTERIIQDLAQPFGDDLVESGIGASIGIALSTTGYENIDEILRHADTAMYRAKAAGRSGYAIFDTEMFSRMRAQIELENELRDAVTGNQLALHYHPVVALDGGSIAGMEALVRWDHPERGILLPREFMPLAERTGLIVEIGWWVLREACRQLRAWQIEYPHTAIKLTMSVNLSARQFLHPNLVQKVDAILEETAVPPECLRFDLTEGVVTQNRELAARLLEQLRERGIQICIDDFGTGYSNLAQLRELPISVLKIAPSFVHDLSATAGGSDAIVQTIIAIGRSMAIDAIAEGVETPEQVEQLRMLGTKFAQGFLFSLPVDSEHARAMLA